MPFFTFTHVRLNWSWPPRHCIVQAASIHFSISYLYPTSLRQYTGAIVGVLAHRVTTTQNTFISQQDSIFSRTCARWLLLWRKSGQKKFCPDRTIQSFSFSLFIFLSLRTHTMSPHTLWQISTARILSGQFLQSCYFSLLIHYPSGPHNVFLRILSPHTMAEMYKHYKKKYKHIFHQMQDGTVRIVPNPLQYRHWQPES